MRRGALSVAALAMLLTVDSAWAEAPTASPAVEAVPLAAIRELSARLDAGASATSVLEAWCAERGMAAEPRLVAQKVADIRKPLEDVQRRRLAIGPEEPVVYRRVRLSCGGHVLSEADNWYVPSRLTPEMNAQLATTDAPFGRVVKPLSPSRRHLSMRRIWTGDEGVPPGPDEAMFSVSAVLSTGAGVPFCEVVETYKGAILAGRAP